MSVFRSIHESGSKPATIFIIKTVQYTPCSALQSRGMEPIYINAINRYTDVYGYTRTYVCTRVLCYLYILRNTKNKNTLSVNLYYTYTKTKSALNLRSFELCGYRRTYQLRIGACRYLLTYSEKLICKMCAKILILRRYQSTEPIKFLSAAGNSDIAVHN